MTRTTKSELKPLDKNTYGNTPAAEYLVKVLNDHIAKKTPGIHATVREIGTHLSNFQTVINELDVAAEEGILSYKSMVMLMKRFRQDIDKWMPNISVDDPLIRNLTRNVMTGSVKEISRELTEVHKLRLEQKEVQRKIDKKQIVGGTIRNKDGIPLFVAGKATRLGLGDVYVDHEEFVDRLREKNAHRIEKKHDA